MSVAVVTTEYELGELVSIKHGYAFKSQYFSDDGNKIVTTPGNFIESGGFKHKGKDKEKWYQGPIPEGYELKKGDIIVAMTEQMYGLLGSSAIIPESGLYLHNQRLGLVDVIDEGVLDKTFVYYLFNAKYVRDQIQATANGAKVRHTSIPRICEVKVELPPIGYQRWVGKVLSSYDDLIENNNRRIAILEDIAQSLYREWFVKFRYPGHENQNLIVSPLGSIPEGWEVKTLKEVIELAYGKALKKNDRKGGTVAVFGSGGLGGWHDQALVSGPIIIVGRKGNVGKVFWVEEDCWPIDTVFYVKSDFSKFYLYYNLLSQVFHNSDAAVPGLNRDSAYSNKIIVPSKETVERFDGTIAGIFAQLNNLRKKNENLKSQRDLLLPKLISGKINLNDA